MSRKIFLMGGGAVLLVILLTLVGFSVDNGTRMINRQRQREGFTTLLAQEDICTLALQGNNLWAGGANGVFRVDTQTLQAEKTGDFSMVRALLVTDRGLWVGHDEGITLIGEETVTYTTANGLPDNRVNALMEDSAGRIWAGTWGGAAILDGENITVITQADGLLDNMVNVLTEDAYGGIWFGSYVAPRGGISVKNGDSWQYFTTENDLLHANINAIIPLQDGRMLTGGGLYTKGGGTYFRREGAQWVREGWLQKQDGLAGEKLRSLFQDKNGTLWVGSEYDGLAVRFPEKTVILTAENGLSNDEVKAIKEDEEGAVWVGTRKGLVRIEKGGVN